MCKKYWLVWKGILLLWKECETFANAYYFDSKGMVHLLKAYFTFCRDIVPARIKGPDNPTSQLLPILSFKGCSGDGEGRKDKGGGERLCVKICEKIVCMYVCMYVLGGWLWIRVLVSTCKYCYNRVISYCKFRKSAKFLSFFRAHTSYF